MSSSKGFTYWMSMNRLYLSVTSRHALMIGDAPLPRSFQTLYHSRGPGFSIPSLPIQYEPSALEMAEAVEVGFPPRISVYIFLFPLTRFFC